MAKPADLLQGTLDMLILKAVSLGPLHGYGVLLRIQQISGNRLEIQQGSLYPALYRLERQELIESEWGASDNNRKARFYKLTAAGRRQLAKEARVGAQQRWPLARGTADGRGAPVSPRELHGRPRAGRRLAGRGSPARPRRV